ncbi:MAG: hypothetical protein KatS3mg101_0090 [Patescibacteria group bacterium]|nr:MAG: hypothetical protein KatS3mg101_0090 [Patescibacteria group bacterium]
MKNKTLIAVILLTIIAGALLISKPVLTVLKQQSDISVPNQQKPKDEMAVIREFMDNPNLELVYVRQDLPQPYYSVGKSTKVQGGVNLEAAKAWLRQINVYEDAKPLSDNSCSVYQYHVDPRNQVITQVVTRGLNANEIETLKQKGVSCINSNIMPVITKEEAEQIASGYLKRALPNFEELKDQFVYSFSQKESHTWMWEDKNYKLSEGLTGKPYSYPIVRLTVYGNGQILYWNTIPLFQK